MLLQKEFFKNRVASIFYDFVNVTISENSSMKKENNGANEHF